MMWLFRPIHHSEKEVVTHTALRGIAALCVVFYHAQFGFGSIFIPGITDFAAHGFLFVDLFFVLSGYVICLNYDQWFGRNGITSAPLRTFAARRIFRLYPNYLAWFLIALLASVVLSLQKQSFTRFGTEEWYSVLLHLVMLQGILEAPKIWNLPLWSIAVEMVSYATFPVLSVFLVRARTVALAGIVVASVGLWIALCSEGTIDIVRGGNSVLRGIAGFWMGVLVASFRHRPLRVTTPILSLLQACVFAAVLVCIAERAELVALGLFVVLVYLTQENRGAAYAVARLGLFHRLGELSFSVYLAHTTVLSVVSLIWWWGPGDLDNKVAGFLIVSLCGALGTILVAQLSYRYLEVPSNRWLRRKFG